MQFVTDVTLFEHCTIALFAGRLEILAADLGAALPARHKHAIHDEHILGEDSSPPV